MHMGRTGEKSTRETPVAVLPSTSQHEPTVRGDKNVQVSLTQDQNQRVEIHIFHHSHGSAVIESLQKSVRGLQESIRGSHINNFNQVRRGGRGGCGHRGAYS